MNAHELELHKLCQPLMRQTLSLMQIVAIIGCKQECCLTQNAAAACFNDDIHQPGFYYFFHQLMYLDIEV